MSDEVDYTPGAGIPGIPGRLGVLLEEERICSVREGHECSGEDCCLVAAVRAQLEWRPIETAPKDGIRILAWDGEDGPLVVWWEQNRWWTDYAWHADKDPAYPTHWRPIGPGPEGK